MNTESKIWEMIHLCEKTFAKDDIDNTDPSKLRELVGVLYDKLQEIVTNY